MFNPQAGSDDFKNLNREALGKMRGRVQVRGKTDRLKPVDEFASDLERQAFHVWAPSTGAIEVRYEPATLHLHVQGQKVRDYTPDLWLIFPSGELWIVEVKGSFKAHASGRSSKINLQHAAVEYAWLGRWFALLPDEVVDDQVLTWKLTEFNGATAPEGK